MQFLTILDVCTSAGKGRSDCKPNRMIAFRIAACGGTRLHVQTRNANELTIAREKCAQMADFRQSIESAVVAW